RHQPALGHRRVPVARDDQVIVDGYAHQLSRLDELARDANVFAARLRISGWVVVEADDRGGMLENRQPKHGSRLYDAGGQPTLTYCAIGDDDVGRVEKYDLEHLPGEIPHLRHVDGRNVFRRAHLNSSAIVLSGLDASTDLEYGSELNGLRRPDSHDAHPLPHVTAG